MIFAVFLMLLLSLFFLIVIVYVLAISLKNKLFKLILQLLKLHEKN